MGYSHQEIEKKWKEHWAKNQTFFTNLADKTKPKKYILVMFPYPSGSGLHVGHIRNYMIADALARFYRFRGYNVLMPIGWDAFGLPAEQYAIQTGNHPATFTNNNIQKFKEQLVRMGFSYDWSKEINTSAPEYYRWTQWIFCQIYQQGLAEYKEIPVYWCEKLGTVLANEEIKNVDGKKVSERGNFPVIEKKIPQWVLKITQYAPKLLAGLEKLDWPNSIKSLQKNWIGLSKGTIINFPLEGKNLIIPVFTTRPDTIYGVVAITLSINHSLIPKIVLPEYQKNIVDFQDYWSDKKESKEIAGEFTGSYCLNPLNNEKIPIWITNFVIGDYGTGAVMISPYFSWKTIRKDWKDFPFHTRSSSLSSPSLISKQEGEQNKEIDFTFAKKYQLSAKGIISSGFYLMEDGCKYEASYVNSPLINGIRDKNEAIEIINQELEKKQTGQRTEVYHLKDWVFSRQRYWGEPIPVIHWENNQKELLPEKYLPLTLPSLIDFAPNPRYYSPLQKAKEWINVENKSGLKGKRDINVMPQWAGSCWYYIAFLLKQKDSYLSIDGKETKEIIKNWLPVDVYIGGQEHANLHLLYARFWHKVLYKIGVVKHPEPFQRLICQGIVLGADGEKMSKSRGNVVNPDELIKQHGADALRLYEVFLGPADQTTNFDVNGVRAMKKWLDRVYNFFVLYREVALTDIRNEEIETAYAEMVIKVNIYYENVKLNLVVSSLMEFINKCYQAQTKVMPLDCFLGFLKLLNPLAPHISEEMWSYFKEKPINESSWPQAKNSPIFSPSQINIVVQINGQKKAIISASPEKNQSEIELMAKNDPIISKVLAKKKIIKIIFMKNKLINFVI